tara:strand:+ start:71 stop:385 length:315 start_codon:yes stop_codon:yes gene_type:complete
MAFASGKEAYGICDITGFRYKRREMKKTWDGLIVGPDQFSPKHPQLDPKPKPNDPEAIRNPRPETSVDNTSFVLYTNVDKGILGTKLETYQISVSLGEVTITTS